MLAGNTYLLVAIVLFDLVMRGFGLWKSARNGQRNWFIAILIINSIGILPILYMQFFQKKHKKSHK